MKEREDQYADEENGLDEWMDISKTEEGEIEEEDFRGDIELVEYDDVVSLYRKQALQEPLLTVTEESQLAERMELGKAAKERLENERLDEEVRISLEKGVAEGLEARDRLIRSNLRWVMKIAIGYARRGTALADLIQDGNEGLTHAVDKFDYKMGNRLSTYATYWINQRIKRGFTRNAPGPTMPTHVHERVGKLREIEKEVKTRGGKVNYEEIAEELNRRMGDNRGRISGELAKNVLSYRGVVSLDEPMAEGDFSERGETIEDTETPLVFEQVSRKMLAVELTRLIETLPEERQKQIIKMRFGLEPFGQTYTLEEIGNEMGISRERVRQLERSALRFLRYPKINEGLRDFLRE